MQSMIEQLRATTDHEDLRTTVATLIEVLCDEHERLTERNAALAERVRRLERVLVAVGGATEVIEDRPTA